ncbi:PDZ domain-containing protein [Candidatus Peregrinibacteria bacterium]|nr:MAG: PDZ domain-containing protein [Candidatus Peregrinibacteria bacterium]
METIQTHGEIVRPYLGVRYMMLDAARAKELKIDVETGALLVGDELQGLFAVIPGGPADKAGLKIRDVILTIDGQTIDADHPLQRIIGQKKPGDTVTLSVWRSGETLELKVVLDQAQ